MLVMKIFSCDGGHVSLPDPKLVLVDRRDGGNLIVSPARDVWDRSELTATELTQWSLLVAAAGRAMLDVLPQLAGGCINYWDAGNWALHDDAPPAGRKVGREHRHLHLHLLGRSQSATNPAWRWGEAPKWPDYADRFEWAAANERLTDDECAAIAARVKSIFKT